MQSIFLSFAMEAVSEYKVTVEGKELTLNVQDIVLLDYIVRAFPAKKLQHIKDDGVSYVWLQHDHIIEDLPILRVAKPRLKQMLAKLKDMNLLTCRNYANKKAKGSRAYYAITESCFKLIYNEQLKDFYKENVFTLKNFNMKDTACKNSYTSNSILDTNNILDKSKDLYINIEKNCSQLNNSQSKSTNNVDNTDKVDSIACSNSFLGSAKKKSSKKPFNIQWKEIIDDFTNNRELKDTIYEYLRVNNENRHVPFYPNVLKGKLKELKAMSANVDDQIRILKNSISYGYITLYDVTQNNYNNTGYKRTRRTGNVAVDIEGGTLQHTKQIINGRVVSIGGPENEEVVDENGKPIVF